MLFYSSKKPLELNVINLNERQYAVKEQLTNVSELHEESSNKFCQVLKCLMKKQKNDKKKKNDAKDSDSKKEDVSIVYVLDFIGDIKATDVEKLRDEISAIISYAKPSDEVVVRIESTGGQVHSYGLAAAQLARIKTAGLHLIVCVDKVAASGGYMMACVADKILVAPFAIIGSIGVVSQMPNFYEFLKKHDIDVELFTAGEYKRTVTMFGENSDKDRAKYQEELERIHQLFKEHVQHYRPKVAIDRVATGEFWLGSDAVALDLADQLATSDSYLLEKLTQATVLMLHSKERPTLAQKLGLSELAADGIQGVATWLQNKSVTTTFDKVVAKLS